MTAPDDHRPDPDDFVSREWICHTIHVSDRQLGRMLGKDIALFRPNRGRQPALIQARAVYDYMARESERAERDAAQERNRKQGRSLRKQQRNRPD